MATIFDVMSSDITIAGDMQFTVDESIPSVAVQRVVTDNIFSNANGDKYFALGDNITIQGIFVNIPYGFGQADGLGKMTIEWIDSANALVAIPELATNSILSLPGICETLRLGPAGLFIKAPVAVPGRIRLVLPNIVLNVSMLNAPALINLATIKVQVHLEITHTTPLTAVP